MRNYYTILTFFFALLVIMITGCRESFDSDFPDLLIINNAPELLEPIEEQVFGLPEGEGEVDMAEFVTDVEGDAVIYTATSSDNSVATLVVESSRLVFNLLSVGETTISFVGTDGNSNQDGVPNEVSGSFLVIVQEEIPEEEEEEEEEEDED